jgi:hypothetical protein
MCTLNVDGKSFDVRAYLAGGAIRPCRVYERGQPRRRGGRVTTRDASGFHVGVSNAAWDALGDQCRDAFEFLRRHEADLRRLAEEHEVEAVLDFPAEASPEQRHVVIWSQEFPPELLRAAGDLGIGLGITLYFATRDASKEPSAEAGAADGGE